MPYSNPAGQLPIPWAPQSETSQEAAIAAGAFSALQRDRVAEWFAGRESAGGTQKEASEGLEIGRASMSPRVLELVAERRLVKTSIRRGGCAVYVAPLHLDAFERRHGIQ